MEDWELDFEWLRIRHFVKDSMQKDALPDLKTILFLVGIQELGQVKTSFTKEEKQDLMHVAVCSLLESEGLYEFKGRDEEGWPHFERLKRIDKMSVSEQETLLKKKIIQYFNER